MAVRRTLSSLTLTAVLLAGTFVPVLFWLLPLVIIIAALMGVYEYCQLASRHNAPPIYTLALLFTVALLYDAYCNRFAHLPVIIITAVILTGMVYTFLRNYAGSITGVATTVFGAFWVGIPLSLGLLLLGKPDGKYILMFVLAVVWLTDVGAYFVGCNWGRHKITPRLSPNKTIEGTLGGLVFAILTALIIRLILPSIYGHLFTMREVVLLGASFGIVSQIGDLVESAFKRDAGVKDSGRTRTGHGGILDLIDSVVFSLPLMYLYLYFFPR